MKEFTNKYPSQKTLRFELQPQGKTRDYIDKNGILLRDKERNESSQSLCEKKHKTNPHVKK